MVRVNAGVKQELYAHFVLVTLARIFEGQAEEMLPENLMGRFKNELQRRDTLKSTSERPEDMQSKSPREAERLSFETKVKSPEGHHYKSENNTKKAKIPKLEVLATLNEKEKNEGIKTRVKLNFKNCLLVLQRTIEHLFLLNSLDFVTKRVPRVLNSIVRLRQKIRPDRHYPRISKKPLKRRRKIPKKEELVGAAIAAPG